MIERNNKPLKPLKWYKDLADGKARREEAAFLIEGEKAVAQVVESYPDWIIRIIATGAPAFDFRRYEFRAVNEEQLRYISQTKTPQGIAAVVRLPMETYGDKLPETTGDRVLLLEDIQDPGNVGTLIRTAAAFGFSGVILSEKCADPFSPKCLQATVGTVLSLWLRRHANCLEMAKELKTKQFALIATDLNGNAEPEMLRGQSRLILALGNEAAGISRDLLDLSDARVYIPLDRQKAESLNVAISGAILMYLSTIQC